MRRSCGFRIGVVIAVWTLLPSVQTPLVVAHEGPPFPILMDEKAGEFIVSVWADPDIGEAAFYIVLESPEGGRVITEPVVSMWVQPVTGRLERATYQARRQTLRNRMQFEAKPQFDQRDQWEVGFRIEPSGGEPAELTTQVESTPPGGNAWILLLYMFPFALLGGFWIAAMVRKRRLR